MDNLDEMDKFLETQYLSRLNHEETKNLNRSTTSKEIESVITNIPTKKSPGTDDFFSDCYQTFKEEPTSIFLKLFLKVENEEIFLLNSFYKAGIILSL